VPVEKEYTLDTEEGKKTLVELFDGRSQLLIYHLMFVHPTKLPVPAAPAWPTTWTRRSST
jgi:predicted dithiol-disulfide oxidoreductase (DUF899 family)